MDWCVVHRGVVQLFNAVRKHQKDVDEKVKEAGGSERKKAKILATVSKRDFINVLRGTEGTAEAAKAVKAEVCVCSSEVMPSQQSSNTRISKAEAHPHTLFIHTHNQ